jgi:hypothetical protein
MPRSRFFFFCFEITHEHLQVTPHLKNSVFRQCLLLWAGCAKVYAEKVSGAATDRASDWSDVVKEIEFEFVVECSVDRVYQRGHKERVSVRSRIHDCLGCDIAGGPGPVLDDELLAEPLRQRSSDQTGCYVGGAAGAKPAMMRTGRVG